VHATDLFPAADVGDEQAGADDVVQIGADLVEREGDPAQRLTGLRGDVVPRLRRRRPSRLR
jgi:hypothetical protein